MTVDEFIFKWGINTATEIIINSGKDREELAKDLDNALSTYYINSREALSGEHKKR